MGLITLCACRYIWAYRSALARSVHDMAKQMYDNKLYSPKAWQPLSDWLFDCSKKTAAKRGLVLCKFNNKDTDFFKVVAECLWALARGPNMPWGRKATRPHHYLVTVPITEKVRAGE